MKKYDALVDVDGIYMGMDEDENGLWSSSDVTQALYDALKPALRYIEFVGASHTDRGFDHPQQQLIDLIEKAISLADGDEK